MTEAPVTPARPAWSTFGGGGILAAALLLFTATILEYVYWVPAEGDAPGVLVGILVTFGLSILLYLASSFPLAFGSRGSNGIVGGSVVGKVAFVVFGVSFAALQTLYLVTTYGTGDEGGASGVVSAVFAVLQYAGILTAAIMVARVGVARGLARWSLLIATLIGAVCVAFVQTAQSYEVVTIAYGVFTIVQAIVGVTYLVAGRKAG